MKMRFEWDEEKAKANLKKHRIDFDETTTVFIDPNAITICDPGHSADEERYIDIGCSIVGRVLVVVYTERSKKIRIIGCRKATAKELKIYEESNG